VDAGLRLRSVSSSSRLDPPHAFSIRAHVDAVDMRLARALDLADLRVVAGNRLSFDFRLVLEVVGLVGVAVEAIEHPVQARRPGGAEQQERRSAADVKTHDECLMNQNAIVSTTLPTVSAVSRSFHCCTGTLPIVSPVRPFTAM